MRAGTETEYSGSKSGEEPRVKDPHPCCIRITHPSGNNGVLSCAIPFPEAFVSELHAITIKSIQGKVLNSQAAITSRWPDKSFRWVKVWWLNDQADSIVTISRNSQEPSTTTYHCNSTQEIAEEAGANKIIIPGASIQLTGRAEGGTFLSNIVDSYHISENGPVVRTAQYKGRLIFSEDLLPIKWYLQICMHVSTNITKALLTIRNPRAASHRSGIWELGDRNSCKLKSLALRFIPDSTQFDSNKSQERSSTKRSVKYRFTPSEEWNSTNGTLRIRQLGSGGENFNSGVHRNRDGETPITYNGYQAFVGDQKVEGKRALPAIVIATSEADSLGITVPYFWQTFPNSLAYDGRAIELELSDTNNPLELQPGEQRTTEFHSGFGNIEKVMHGLNDDGLKSTVSVRVDPEWIRKSRVTDWWVTQKSDGMKSIDRYLQLVNLAVEEDNNFFNKREVIDEFGWRNYGDFYGDHENDGESNGGKLVSHYNNQYDVLFGLGIQFLNGNDERFGRLFYALARHVIDIDIYHTEDDLPLYNHGMFWHTAHYVDAGLSTHRSYPRGTCGGGPSSGHAYSRGLWLYYCLTGDQTAYETVVKMADWIIAAEDGAKTKYRWFAGGDTGLTSASGLESYHGPGRGPGNSIEILLNAFDATLSPIYLNQAEYMIRRVVHPEQDINALDLTDAENRWFYLITLQALGRYLETKIHLGQIDMMFAYTKKVILLYASWMVDNERPFLSKREDLEYPTETWAAQDLRKVEVFQWAARHTTEKERKQYLDKAAWFFDHAVEELHSFPTKNRCRPLAIVLTNGYSHAFFRNGHLEKVPPSPSLGVRQFPPQQRFKSQKQRAIRNVKLVGVAISVLLCISVILVMGRGVP